MKYVVRLFLFHIFSLWITMSLLPALSIRGSWHVIVMAAFILSILVLLVKPLLKILFIPINLLTFGLFSWMINVVVIYLLTVLVPEIQIHAWNFPGFSYGGFVIPSFKLNYYMALISVSLFITGFSNLLHGLSES